jgi:PAS domain S-box-containing protein
VNSGEKPPPTPPESFRVLLVEGSPSDRFFLTEMIERDCAPRFNLVFTAETLEGAIEAAKLMPADVALLDLTLPDAWELQAFDRMREAAPGLPIVVLADMDDEELGGAAVARGAADFLVKGRIDGIALQRAMRYAILRGRAEAALAHERELLSTLLENLPDRIYFKDRESRFIRINHALVQLLGLAKAEDAYGMSDFDFYNREHAAEARADEVRVMESGEPLMGKVEEEILGGGRRSWSLTTKMPLRDHRGIVIGTCGISREITAIKEMELALAAERNLLRSVIDNLPDAIFLKDTKGRYLLDNAAHWRSLGLSGPEEVLGRSVFDFFPAEVAAQFHGDDLAIIKSGEPLINREERTHNTRRSPRWVLTTKVPWRDEDGSVLGLLCMTRDVTEQKEAAERLKKAYAEVERSREETLRALSGLQDAHQELRSVQLQLVEAEKMKSVGRLAAGVAHEVKNPLAVIRMGLEFFQAHLAGDATALSVIQEMTDAVLRADGVIRGLLDFSAPKKLELAPVSLNALIDASLRLVRGEQSGTVKIVREFQHDLPSIPIDGAKVNQVFVNVFTNALHAMQEGGTLTVRTYSKQLTGVGANIGDSRSESFRVGQTLIITEIDDTGTGIPEDKLGKIFDPFFTTKPTGKGTGLGLSVVKTIVDLHGGTVDVRNLPKGGARVTLMFHT